MVGYTCIPTFLFYKRRNSPDHRTVAKSTADNFRNMKSRPKARLKKNASFLPSSPVFSSHFAKYQKIVLIKLHNMGLINTPNKLMTVLMQKFLSMCFSIFVAGIIFRFVSIRQMKSDFRHPNRKYNETFIDHCSVTN